MQTRHLLAVSVALACWCSAPTAFAVKAALPHVDDVPAGTRYSIDGLWRVQSIGKRVRIEAGRAVVVDPWKHLFIFDVEKDMVVIRDIVASGAGTFEGDDLPLQGRWNARLDDAEEVLEVTVAGAMGEAKYRMVRVPDEVEPEVEPEEEATGPPAAVPARQVGAAGNLGCPGKQSYFSTLRGGSCWTCPDGYKRTARAMDSPHACKKRKSLTGPWLPARHIGSAWGCPKGQFHIGPVGGGHCFTCPSGYKRVHVAGADSRMCVLRG